MADTAPSSASTPAAALRAPQIRSPLDWIRGYDGKALSGDLVAALVVTALLVPQALAYALLADLPPQTGIYASILPLVAYVAFGSSRHLTVGPTAVVSLITAAAIATVPEGERLVAAAALAVMAGSFLLVLSVFKAGTIMNFVSRPVVQAYITGAALLILISQLRHVLGVDGGGRTALDMLAGLRGALADTNPAALAIGLGSIAILLLARRYAAYAIFRMGVGKEWSRLLARAAPVLVVALAILVSAGLDLSGRAGLATVGVIPGGLPDISVPMIGMQGWMDLAIVAMVVGLVAFVDSMTIAQTLAAKARERTDANRELMALGMSNITAGFSGAYPVNGSLSRSIVNFTAGAKTPAAGLITAGLMTLAALFLTPVLRALPLSTLAALIIVACLSLLDFKGMWRTWVYSRADGITAIATFLAVLLLGVQWGVLAGVVLAMALHIRTTLTPHIVEVGRFPGTEHYRDASRFIVETDEEVKTLRIDESLYYANARYLEDEVAKVVSEAPSLTDLVLMCPAVNRIDASALESLFEINRRLQSANVRLHLSELHSHVRDRLYRSNFLDKLTGQVFMSQHLAMEALAPEPDWDAISDHIDIH